MQILDLSFWQEAGRGIAAWFCKGIYWLIAWLYELFLTISRVNILSSEEIAPIYQRVTMILTIVMVFYITFEFVKYVVQPDTINDKEKGAGNVALKMVIVILLIAFVPRVFTMAYDLQGRILDTQFLSKVILGNNKVNSEMGDYGKSFSADVFSVFYKVNEEACNGCDAVNTVNFNLNRLASKGDLRYLDAGLNDSAKVKSEATGKMEDTPTIEFDGIFAILVGGFMAYILVLYCVDVGTRYAQLIFLQIMSPIAILGYLAPKKDNMFNKWVKQCVGTYLDLFIRIIIIYFILLLCKVLGDAYGTGKLFAGLGEIPDGIKAFTYIALVMGLLMFAQKAPKMLKELLPSMGGAAGIGFGLKGAERVAPAAARAIGAGAGGLAGAVKRGTSHAINEAKRRKDIKDRLAQQGKPTDRKNMRQALKEDRKAERNARREYNQRRKELENNNNRLFNANKEYDAAREAYAKNPTLENKRRLEQATSAQRQAQQAYDFSLKGRQALEDRMKHANNNYSAAMNEREQAQRELNNLENKAEYINASATDKQKMKEKAEKKVKDATINLQNAQKEKDKAQEDYNINKDKETYNQVKLNYESAKSQVATDEHNDYGQNIILQTAGAAVGGLFAGIKTGSQATKFEDISKKVAEAGKNAQVAELERAKWLEEGGGATTQAAVKKVIAKLQQTVGVKTASEMIKQEVKVMESQIKAEKALIDVESKPKSSIDGTEDRLKDKIEELKVPIKNSIKTGLKDENGNDIMISKLEGETAGDTYRRIKSDTARAKSEADSAAKAQAALEQNGITSGAQYEAAVALATRKAKEAQRAEFVETQAHKNIARDVFTQILQDPDPQLNSKFDPVAVQKVLDAKMDLKIARSNPSTVEKMRAAIYDPNYNLSEADFNAYMTGNISDFDQIDRIKVALINISNDRKRTTQESQEIINQINASDATAAANATASATNSGKK